MNDKEVVNLVINPLAYSGVDKRENNKKHERETFIKKL